MAKRSNIKFLYIAIAALVIILCAVVALTNIVQSSEHIRAYIPQMSNAVDRNDWDEALALYNECQHEWQGTSKIWPILINHDDMRDIEISFIDLGVLLRQQNRQLVEQELATLNYYLKHVPENETVNIQNIL